MYVSELWRKWEVVFMSSLWEELDPTCKGDNSDIWTLCRLVSILSNELEMFIVSIVVSGGI